MGSMLMFPGQGSQALKMGFDFFNNYKAAREVFEEVDDALEYKLSSIIFGEDSALLSVTEHTQPALMAVSIAIFRTLVKEGYLGKIDYMAGHSLGEYSALCAANAISLHDTAVLLKTRANAMKNSCIKNPGSMLALLGLDLELAQKLCDAAQIKGIIVVANDNSTGQIVLSGEMEAIDYAAEKASDFGIKKAIKLNVQGAFHSPLMQDAQQELLEKLNSVIIKEPTVPVFSNVTAQVYSLADIKPFLVRQITSSVKWREILINAKELGINNFIEIGSGKVLSGLVKKTLDEVAVKNVEKIEDLV